MDSCPAYSSGRPRYDQEMVACFESARGAQSPRKTAQQGAIAGGDPSEVWSMAISCKFRQYQVLFWCFAFPDHG